MQRITFIFSIICIIGCHSKVDTSRTTVEHIPVKISSFKQFLDISEFFDAEFIMLELTSESMIGKTDKVKVTENHILVLDEFTARKLFLFDRQGKFIRTIGKQGRGKGEYLVLKDFDVHDERIYLSSQQNNKMLVYDFEGNHIEDIKFDDYIGMHFNVLKNGDFLIKSTGGGNKSAIFYSKYGKVKNVVSSRGYNFLRHSGNHCFTEFQKQKYMYFALNDTIYSVDAKNEALTPKYVVDFGKKTFPIQNIKNKEEFEAEFEKPYMHLGDFYASEKYFYLSLHDNEYIYNVICNKSTNDIKYGNRQLYKGFPISGFSGSTNDGFILTWRPEHVSQMKEQLDKEFEFLPKESVNTTQNANPGIVILKEKIKE